MNLSQVEYFLAVANKLNFTVAAKALFISQPALSKQIMLLEKELNTKLFVRDSRKVELTKAGLKLKEELQDIVNMLENAKQNAIKVGDKEQRAFRIGCFDGVVMNDYLPKIVKTIEDNFTETKIIIKRNEFKEIREDLANDEVDIMFTLDFELPELYSYNTKKIISRKGALIYSEKLLRSANENISLKDFEELPLLVTNPKLSEGAFRSALEVASSLGLKNIKIKQIDNFTTLLTYLEMGYGFAILSEDVVQYKNGLRKFSIPSGKEFDKSVIAVWKYENPIIDYLMDNL